MFVYNLRFPGQYYDQETWTHYNYFRDYDPGIGRYVQSDPIGLDGGLNTYGYVGGNPLTLYDSLGLKIEVRCRPVGDPNSPDLRSRIAAGLGGEHCYIVLSCDGVTRIPETTVSYLAAGMSIAPKGGSHTNDTIYSQQGRFRPLDVKSRDGSDSNCPACKIEQCVLRTAELLQATGYRVPHYSVMGANSNSVARRLIEGCGGQMSGSGPLTGWRSSGSVGF